TLTNTGSRGALFDTPIINQPQVGILGTGTVRESRAEPGHALRRCAHLTGRRPPLRRDSHSR
ncbi:MAG: hypothetical protein QOI68_5420, partial [Pseudonocardiales bacterium]|nr:hypothetical protein [Pseudonocardiales bacterium]